MASEARTGGRAALLERVGARLSLLRWLGRAFRGGTTAAAAGLLALILAFAALFAIGAWPAIVRYGTGFFGETAWNLATGSVPVLPTVVGSLLTSGLALLLAVPVALGVAIFTSEVGPRRLRAPLAYILDLGAAIPSIVYGVWGLVVLVPLMQGVIEPGLARLTGGHGPFSGPASGLSVLTASVLLAVMVIPTIAALSREALRAVPRAHREAALSLGATRWDATRMAVLGPARPGIVGAIMLGFGRAIGETIAVALVIGSIPVVPATLFSPGWTIPSLLVDEWSDATGIQLSALIELALVLFVLSLLINLFARLLIRWMQSGRSKLRWFSRPRPGAGQTVSPRRTVTADASRGIPSWWERVDRERDRHLRRRRAVHLTIVVVLAAAVALALLPLASLVETAVGEGGAAVVHPTFYTSEPPAACYGGTSANCSLGGIGPAIQGTLLLLGLASSVAIPAGILTGIYLTEYGRNRFGQAVDLLVDVMAGVPSILIGVFVFALFLRYDRFDSTSALAGGVALAVLMLPIVARATASALGTVPQGVRESALALGFPRHRVTLRVVLGSCRSALVTGNLLALGRAGGETAALLLTAGTSSYWFAGLHSPVAALAPFIYDSLYTSAPNLVTDAWGATLVLLFLMIAISLAAHLAFRGGGTSEAD